MFADSDLTMPLPEAGNGQGIANGLNSTEREPNGHGERMFGRLARALVGLRRAKDWPPLPTGGFISGRAASAADVENGDAIFVAALNGAIIGKPLSIDIPQYAVLRDTRERVILVQAEDANGIKLFGVRGLNGKDVVAKDGDLELLGTRRPT